MPPEHQAALYAQHQVLGFMHDNTQQQKVEQEKQTGESHEPAQAVENSRLRSADVVLVYFSLEEATVTLRSAYWTVCGEYKDCQRFCPHCMSL